MEGRVGVAGGEVGLVLHDNATVLTAARQKIIVEPRC